MANKKTNKKRIGMALASLGLVAAIGATAGTTLAKYISSVEVKSQTATVAQWGYTITANANDLFGKYYNSDGDVEATQTKDSVAVAASTNEIVMPGGHGSMTLSINGKAEVNAVLKIDIDKNFKTIVLRNATANASLEYYPIVWKVGGQEVEGGKFDGEIFAAAVETALSATVTGTIETEYKEGALYVFLPAGTEIKGFNLSVEWAWEFGDEGFDLTNDGHDPEDTLLGLKAAGVSQYTDLPDNIKLWLTEYVKDHTAEGAAYKSAEIAYENATKAYEEAKKAYDEIVAEHAELVAAKDDADAVLANAKKVLGEVTEEKEAADAKVAELTAAGREEGDPELDWWTNEVTRLEEIIADYTKRIGTEESEEDCFEKTAKEAATALTEFEEDEEWTGAATTWEEAQKAFLGESGKGTDEGCAVKTWTDAQDTFGEAVKAYYTAVYGASNTEISFKLGATIVQTMTTDLASFLEEIAD